MSVKTLAASVALAVASAVASNGGSVVLPWANPHPSPVRRALDGKSDERTEDELLCGSANLLVSGAQTGFCPTLGNIGTDKSEWGPCCVFEQKRKNQCRVYEVDMPFCDEENGADCSTLSSTDKLTLDIAFSFMEAEQECCKTCSCFGDPECVSFAGVENLWIPCDARDDSSCKMTKDKCSSMVDSNGNQCGWRGGRKADSSGWDIAMKGSPCWPTISDAPGKKLSMNMYTTPSGDFKTDVVLGERGIIRQVEIELRGEKYTLDAKDCFKKEENAWNTKNLPDEFRLVSKTANEADDRLTQIVWHIFDQESETSTELLCSRALGRRKTGIPRINVQSIATSTTNAESGSGFCSTGQIPEKKGEDSSDLHFNCVGNDHDSALQACKNLVSWGVVDNQLEPCGKEYCQKAEVNNVDYCRKAMGDGTNYKTWRKFYCQSIINQGLINDETECFLQADQGWPYMVETYGNGHRSSVPVENQPCGNAWSDYAIANKRACSAGVNVEVWSEQYQEWTVEYFIPADKPVCPDAELVANAVDHPLLFTRKIRITQCDVTAEEGCEALVATCGKVPGADFTVTFSNAISAIWENKDVLRCAPRFDGDSPYWCLPWKDDMPDDAVCQCPCEDDSRRRLDQALGLASP